VTDAALRALLDRGYRYALSLTHDPVSAEDLVQEAWLSMLQRGAPRHAGYLFATIRNRFIDQQRAHRDHDPDAVLMLVDGRTPLALERISLERALAQLQPEEREALFLSDVEGYTIVEVASLTDRPRGTVASLIRRARQKMRALLSPSEVEAL
jgi:RNA polymerase sigma-70 factor (ECF subfamily)